MKLLIFDTETTGLPKFRESAEKTPNNWPHIVSISWIVLDTETNTEVSRKSYVVKPMNWVIPEESTKIHGITMEHANQFGVNLFYAIDDLLKEPCDRWVAHNMDFDMNVVMHAVLWDLKLQCPMIRPRKICTMLLGKNICKLPGKYRDYKMPKLKELYFKTFGKNPVEHYLHNSMYDVQILTEIIKTNKELRTAMGLTEPDVQKSDGKTLTICIKHVDTDMGK
jgi:DNA polymerase III epsilon subunit-like protein